MDSQPTPSAPNGRLSAALMFVVPSILLFGLAVSPGPDSQEKPQPAPKPKPDSSLLSYNDEIFDLLDANCLGCHAQGESTPSELYMDTYEDLMTGGKHGPPVVPGDPEKSILYQKVMPNPPFGKQMPIKTRRMLKPEETDLIKRWIAAGAIEAKPTKKK